MRASASSVRQSRTLTLPAAPGGLDLFRPFTDRSAAHSLIDDNWVLRPHGRVARPGYTSRLPVATGGAVRRMWSLPGDIVHISGHALIVGGQHVATVPSGDGWLGARIDNPGLHMLMLVNGQDEALLVRDGTASVPQIEGVDSRELAAVVNHERRLYFGDREKPVVWYLEHQAISGSAKKISFASNQRRTGKIVALGSYSGRLLIATEHELLAYRISDPSHIEGIALEAVVPISRPVSKYAFSGGMLLTEAGLFDVEALLGRSDALREADSLSRPVDRARSGSGGEVVESLSQRVLLLPGHYHALPGQSYLFCRSGTGAWTRWRIREHITCWLEHEDGLYFGTADGKICRMGAEADNGRSIDLLLQTRFQQPGSLRRMQAYRIRPMVYCSRPYRPHVSLIMDYQRGPDERTDSQHWDWSDVTWERMPRKWIKPLPGGLDTPYTHTWSSRYLHWAEVRWANMPRKWLKEISGRRARWRSVHGNGVDMSVLFGARTNGDFELAEFDLVYGAGKA